MQEAQQAQRETALQAQREAVLQAQKEASQQAQEKATVQAQRETALQAQREAALQAQAHDRMAQANAAAADKFTCTILATCLPSSSHRGCASQHASCILTLNMPSLCLVLPLCPCPCPYPCSQHCPVHAAG